MSTERAERKIVIPIFDGITALDAIGPYEVLSRLRRSKVVFAAATAGPVRTDNGMLCLVADAALAEVDELDVLLVPGGIGTRPLIEDEGMLRWLRSAHERTQWTTSVCTGSLLLAAAGILTGLDATTHWLEMDTLARLGARPVHRRVVDAGSGMMTAAGVSAGIDMALVLASELEGEETAQAIQLAIEYDPQPPFSSGSPRAAASSVVERVRRAAAQQSKS